MLVEEISEISNSLDELRDYLITSLEIIVEKSKDLVHVLKLVEEEMEESNDNDDLIKLAILEVFFKCIVYIIHLRFII